MSNTKYQYVKNFEKIQKILPQTYIIIRIDGKGFTKFTESHEFEKPNDMNGLQLMNHCAQQVMKNFPDIFIAYGYSDEYSFGFKQDTTLFDRDGNKLVSTVLSCFSGHYALNFQEFMNRNLKEPPIFDGKNIVLPNFKCFQDYFCQRQINCHTNNLYNTCYWLMIINDKLKNVEAQHILKDTDVQLKNEILFQKFGINYNNEPFIYRKGSIQIRVKDQFESKNKEKWNLSQLHEDLILDVFWTYYQQSLCF